MRVEDALDGYGIEWTVGRLDSLRLATAEPDAALFVEITAVGQQGAEAGDGPGRHRRPRRHDAPQRRQADAVGGPVTADAPDEGGRAEQVGDAEAVDGADDLDRIDVGGPRRVHLRQHGGDA